MIGARYSRGDTIVELVVAFAIFALAAVGTMALLNSGVSTTQRDLEVTLVRQQINAQAELLRHIHDSQDALWASLVTPGNLTTTPAPISADQPICPAIGSASLDKGFYIKPVINADPTMTTFSRQSTSTTSFYQATPTTYARIDYAAGAVQSQGIWIQVAQAEDQSGGSIHAYDFYIHACWDSVGVGTPMTLGTIVRLYAQ